MNQPLHARWLVVTGILMILSILATYLFLPSTVENQPTQYIPMVAPLPTVNAQVNQYLITHYASSDRNSRQVTYYRRMLCSGVECETWGIIPGPDHLEIFVRCYPQTGFCLPTHEEYLIAPLPGQAPSVTPFAVPTSIETEHGIGIPAS